MQGVSYLSPLVPTEEMKVEVILEIISLFFCDSAPYHLVWGQTKPEIISRRGSNLGNAKWSLYFDVNDLEPHCKLQFFFKLLGYVWQPLLQGQLCFLDKFCTEPSELSSFPPLLLGLQDFPLFFSGRHWSSELNLSLISTPILVISAAHTHSFQPQPWWKCVYSCRWRRGRLWFKIKCWA